MDYYNYFQKRITGMILIKRKEDILPHADVSMTSAMGILGLGSNPSIRCMRGLVGRLVGKRRSRRTQWWQRRPLVVIGTVVTMATSGGACSDTTRGGYNKQAGKRSSP